MRNFLSFINIDFLTGRDTKKKLEDAHFSIIINYALDIQQS